MKLLKAVSFLVPLTVFLPALAKGDDAPDPKGRKLKDWSKKVNQFNLHEHLMKPTKRDLEGGVENSRRLARNAIRLGLDDETHRRLVPDYPPSNLVNMFVQTVELPSKLPRLQKDVTMDELPFGDGPGKFPGLPQGTNQFWDGTGPPTRMWEVVACPVADVDRFLTNPLSCMFGSGDGTLVDFFTDITDDAINGVLSGALTPLATEAIWTFSGLAWLEKLFGYVCDMLGLIDDVISFVEGIGGGIKEAGDWFVTAGNDFASTFGFRNLQENGGEFETCTGHYETCRFDTSTAAECDACLLDEAGVCSDCGTCWQPLFTSVPDMDGLCLGTQQLRNLMTSDAIPIMTSQALYSTLMARYIEKAASTSVIDAVTTALGTDGNGADNVLAKIIQARDDIKTDVDGKITAAKNDITGSIDAAKGSIETKIDGTCSAKRKRRLATREETIEEILASSSDPVGSPEEKIHDFLRSDDAAKKTMDKASRMGLSTDQVEDVLSQLLGDLSGDEADAANDKIKAAFDDPKAIEYLESLLSAEVESGSGGAHAKDLAGRILKTAINPKTRQLEVERLHGIKASLKSIRSNRMSTRGLSDLEGGCDDLVASVKTTIKGFIADLLDLIITNLAAGVDKDSNGDDNAYSKVLKGDKYDTDGVASALTMPLGMVQVLDPWDEDGLLHTVLGFVKDAFQKAVCYFLFGGSGSQCNGVLPSEENKVLPIYQRRNGDIFMNSGCNSEFEGELVWYKPIHAILSKLFEGASKSIIEFINIPINIVQFILDAAMKLFDHMGDVCSYLDDYVQLAKIEATYENTRFALRELACTKAVTLQKGYGCDGIDNTCDDIKEIDECAEDIFPPEITTTAPQECGGETIFTDIQAAEDCVNAYTSAVDDCKLVTTETTAARTEDSCNAAVTFTATAQGCGARPTEDTSNVVIPVKLDSEAPTVDCSFAPGTSLQERFVPNSYGGKLMILCSSDDELKDGDFSMDVEENCDGVVSVDVLVKSNEFANEKMVQLAKQSTIGTPQQMELFIAPTSCKDEGAPNVCKKDPSTDHRLYDIHVTATDQAGNEGKTTCKVIIFSGTLLEGRNKVCGNFAVHARTTVTFAGGTTTINGGDVGVSPGTSVTGVAEIIDGKIVDNSIDFAASVMDAYDAAIEVRADGKTMAIEMGGVTFTPGTYRSATAINLAAGRDVTLDGLGNGYAVFLFQAGTTLVTGASTRVILTNGAKAENVIWALGTAATLGARSVVEGSILAGTAITFGANAELRGCALAQTAVTFSSGGSVQSINGPAQTLEDVADDVIASTIGSTQRFDLDSLSLERSPNALSAIEN